MEGRSEPQNLDDFAAVSRRILQTSPQTANEIWQKCPQKTVGLTDYINKNLHTQRKLQ